MRASTTGWPKLSPRQAEALGFMLQGLSIQRIAERMGIRPSTVRQHAHFVFDKLGVSTFAELLTEVEKRSLAQEAPSRTRSVRSQRFTRARPSS